MTLAKIAFAALLLGPVAFVSGCGRHEAVNPPTEPAQAIDRPDVAPEATGSSGGGVPGTGPASFVGRWSRDVAWCANPQGDRRPVEITPIRFESPDRSCHIYSVDETANGYLAVLQCDAANPARQERVLLTVAGQTQTLTLTYPDEADARVSLHKCTTLADLAPTKVEP